MNNIFSVLPRGLVSTLAIAILLIPGIASADGEYTGFYVGGFDDLQVDGSFGEFAFLVRPDNTAVVAFYNGWLFTRLIDTNVTIQNDGSFSVIGIDEFGTDINGVFDKNTQTVSGTVDWQDQFGAAPSSDFDATRSPLNGIHQAVQGYYAGVISGTVTFDMLSCDFDGNTHMLIDANGTTFAMNETFCVDAQQGSNPFHSGGIVNTDMNSVVTGNMFDGEQFMGLMDFPNDMGAGTYGFNEQGVVIDGNWTVDLVEIIDIFDLELSLLLRNSVDNRWLLYRVFGFIVEDSDQPDMSRNSDYELVSRGDFNGDGQPDALLRDVTGGQNGRWIMTLFDGADILSQDFVDLPRNLVWDIVATKDLDGDGNDDLLLRHSETNRFFVYLFNGLQIKDQGFSNLPRKAFWHVIAVEDYDGNGSYDVIFRDMTGERNRRWVISTMAGINVATQGFVDITRNYDWVPTAHCDLNGDDNADMLLRNSVTGRWFMYLLDNTMVEGKGYIDSTRNFDWQSVGTGDFNGDGNCDLLLRNIVDGRWLMYMYDGTQIVAKGQPNLTTDLSYELVSTDDVNGDRRSDILVRHNNAGTWTQYLMNGTSVNDNADTPMTLNTDWVVQ